MGAGRGGGCGNFGSRYTEKRKVILTGYYIDKELP